MRSMVLASNRSVAYVNEAPMPFSCSEVSKARSNLAVWLSHILHLQPRYTSGLALGLGLMVVQHLEQRIVAQVALRLQRIDQLFERQVLMGLGAQGTLPDLLQQLAERQLHQLEPQHRC